MENRFGIKDLFLFLLVGGLIVVVVMATVQFDRQFEHVLLIEQKQAEFSRDIAGIKRQLAEGVVAVGGGPSGQPATGPAVTSPGAVPGRDPGRLVGQRAGNARWNHGRRRGAGRALGESRCRRPHRPL